MKLFIVPGMFFKGHSRSSAMSFFVGCLDFLSRAWKSLHLF